MKIIRTRQRGQISAAAASIIGVSITAIAGLLVAIVQFGPAWKPVVREWLVDGGPTGKKLNYYIAHATLEPIPNAQQGHANVRVLYNVTAEMFSEKEENLYYSDRIKSGFGIEYAKSIPDLQILNSTQFPANPTLLEFRIDPLKSGVNKFDFNGIAKINILLNQERGKFGPHIPLNTDIATMTVDFSQLPNFQLPADISAQVEGRDKRGSLQYGTGPAIIRNWFKVNKTITIIARNLSEDSSLLLVWGEPI
mgnify:CR=1 FL=1